MIGERVPVGELLARRRPLAIAIAWALEALVSWLLAQPWAELVHVVWGYHPDGDRALWWRAGLVDASDFVVRQRPALQALLASTGWALAAWFLVAIGVLGAMLTALSTRARSLAAIVSRGVALFPRLAGLQLFSALVSALSIIALFFVPFALATGGEVHPTRDVVTVALASLVTAFALLWLLALVDLSRALVARWDVGAARALLLAVRAPRLVARLLARSLPREIASIGLLGFGAAASTAARTVFVIAIVHQLVGFGRVALRASVLARALRLSDEAYADEAELDAALAPEATP